MDKKVVVTGFGIVSGVGAGVDAFASALKSGKTSFVLKDKYIVSEIKDFSLNLNPFEETKKARIQKLTRKASLPIQTSIACVAEAWKMAGFFEDPPPKNRVGIVLGGNNTTTQFVYDSFLKFAESPEYLSPSYAMQFMDTFQLGVLSDIFDIEGEGFTVGGASASGNMGIIQGYRLIKQGLVDVCVIISPMADLSPMDIQGFINIGALGAKVFKDQPEKACRPFDKEHEGFIYGQASACVILESAERAKNPLAEIKGVAVELHASSQTEPSEEAEISVMKRAIQDAKLTLNDINYVNAHGSSSPLGDDVEAAAIKSLFKDVYVNSTKGITGHCLWSAGVVELIAVIIQLRNKFLHPNINLENPVDVSIHFVPDKSMDFTIQNALSASYGFGGINTAIVVGLP